MRGLSDAINRYLGSTTRSWPIPARAEGQELEEYLRGTATRIYELERELAQFHRPYRMEPLAESACRALGLKIVACPRQAECGEQLSVQVEVENGSAQRLGSFVPFPVHLSYRWLGADGRTIVDQGARTLLIPSLTPGEKATYSCRADAPSTPGRHRLRMTLVQESVRWLDTIDPPVSAEAEVDSPARAAGRRARPDPTGPVTADERSSGSESPASSTHCAPAVRRTARTVAARVPWRRGRHADRPRSANTPS